MKIFLIIVGAVLIVGCIATGVFLVRHDAARSKPVALQRTHTFAPWGTKQDYINYLNRTVDPDDPDLWRRIEAVKRRSVWDR